MIVFSGRSFVGSDGPRSPHGQCIQEQVDVKAYLVSGSLSGQQSNSECKALHAVLAFHGRRRPLKRLIRSFEQQPGEQSSCDRLSEIAVRQGANVYTTKNGSVEQLRFVLNKGIPIILAMSSKSGCSEESHFAVAVGIDSRTISLVLPSRLDSDKGLTRTDLLLNAQTVELTEFERCWHWVDRGLGDATIAGWFMVVHFDGRELSRIFAQGSDVTADRRRRSPVLIATWAIFLAEIGLTYLAYSDPNDLIPPLIAIALATIGFTAIDFFARPEKRVYSAALVPRWYRPYLPFWCLVPFIAVVGGSIWVHYAKWTDARSEVRQLAQEVKAAVEWPDDANAGEAKRDNPRPDHAKLDQAKPDNAAGPPSHGTTASAPPPSPNPGGEASGIAAPRTPDAEGDPDIPIVDVVTARGWFAVDDATNRCWSAAHIRNTRETELVQSGDLRDKDQKFSEFALLAWFLPLEDRKRAARHLARARTWRCFTTERVTAKVATIVSTRYRDDKGSPEAKRFAELARVVGHDVLIARGDIDVVCNNIMVDTGSGLTLATAIQALFVFWIPSLLAVSISRALKRARRAHTREDVQRSIDLRDFRIIAEDEYLFLPRVCFAILLVLGTNYVFAPLGLKASYIMSIVDEHALPGHTTFTLWSTSFSQAPVIVVGFVGFLLYALITATQRFALEDFDDRALLALLVRGLVVILLSFALSSSDINELASRMFVFIAGVFPVRALEAIAKRANMTIDPDFSGDRDSSFAGLPGLDPVKVFALRAAGIQSTYDLAAMNIEDVAERVRIDPRLLGRAVDRAILIDAIGLRLTERLSSYGITSATELVDTASLDSLNAPVPSDPAAPADDSAKTLRQAAELVRKRLSTDQRVKSVRGWLARQ